jgi:hypothetical protein
MAKAAKTKAESNVVTVPDSTAALVAAGHGNSCLFNTPQ